MGFSPLHASSVALACNLNTGHISPQFHVVYDNFFETVHTNGEDPSDVWSNLVIVQSFRAGVDDDDPDSLPALADEWLNPSKLTDCCCLLERKKVVQDFKAPSTTTGDDPPLASTPLGRTDAKGHKF
jgi:hypothetical protein